MKKIFSKTQFANIANSKDPITGYYSKEVEAKVEAEFVDGYRWGFDATARRSMQTVTCVYHRSIEGKHGVFFYYDKAKNFHSFICGDTLGEVLRKCNDLAFWF